MAYEFDQTVLRAEIAEAAAFIRGKMQAYDVDCRFTLKIEIEGSADKRDAVLKFNIDFNRNYGVSVSSPRLDAALNELLHRMGFDKAHQALLLTHDETEAARLAGLQAPIPASPEPQD
jgi:hypothetical protein